MANASVTVYTVGRVRDGPLRLRDLSPATRAKMAEEYYKTYDVMTGVRIAATLGGIITLFGLFLFYKSKCRPTPLLSDSGKSPVDQGGGLLAKETGIITRQPSDRGSGMASGGTFCSRDATKESTYHITSTLDSTLSHPSPSSIAINESPQYELPKKSLDPLDFQSSRGIRCLMASTPSTSGVVLEPQPHCSKTTSVVVVEQHMPRSFSPQGIPFINSSSSSSSSLCGEPTFIGSNSQQQSISAQKQHLTLPLSVPSTSLQNNLSIVDLPSTSTTTTQHVGGGLPSPSETKDKEVENISMCVSVRPKITKQLSHHSSHQPFYLSSSSRIDQSYSRKGKTLSLKYKDTRGDSAETRYSSTTSSGSKTQLRDQDSQSSESSSSRTAIPLGYLPTAKSSSPRLAESRPRRRYLV